MQRMDKYEFNIKVEQIKKMVNRSDYETAMKIADTIDWRRVRNVNILSMVASIYEKNEEFQEAKDILLLAFERAPIGKRLLYKLAELAIKEGNVGEAEDYYREFCDLAPEDPRQYILRYLILGAKGAPVEQLIHTLEQYCNVELDEKWLYELAELYNEAGMSELCVLACDKIMLMFGLGKYVDKAMELKLQHAPLTKYQMDLVENRDKYEAKLKAVEQEYRAGAPGQVQPVQAVRPARPKTSVPVYQARQEASYTREPVSFEPEDQDVFDDRTAQEPVSYGAGEREPVFYGQEEQTAESYETERQESITCEPDPDENDGETDAGFSEEETEQGDAAYEASPQAAEEAVYHQPEVAIEPENNLRSRIHEEEVRANLAMEMSRISDNQGNEPGYESEAAQTRVLTDIRELKKGPVYSGSNHLMIEADVPEEGLNLAIESLRKIHQETGAKNQAAKITGEKLNRRGIFTLSDKLTGKDLIIEHAGDMNESILQELNQLMARDETGMNVVLIDTAERLEELHRVYPGLAKRFECIGTLNSASRQEKQPEPREAAKDERPVRRVEPYRPEQPAPARRNQNTQKQPAPAAVKPAAISAVKPAAASTVKPVAVSGVRRETVSSAKTAAAPAKPKVQKIPNQDEALLENNVSDETEKEMDIDEFAKYACQYASDIDCSISGKSMLALYERIEMMEEDGIPLTKTSAEDLIEEAADRAEKPSLVKRMTGIFSSKYDKDGLLILKEEHFI